MFFLYLWNIRRILAPSWRTKLTYILLWIWERKKLLFWFDPSSLCKWLEYKTCLKFYIQVALRFVYSRFYIQSALLFVLVRNLLSKWGETMTCGPFPWYCTRHLVARHFRWVREVEGQEGAEFPLGISVVTNL